MIENYGFPFPQQRWLVLYMKVNSLEKDAIAFHCRSYGTICQHIRIALHLPWWPDYLILIIFLEDPFWDLATNRSRQTLRPFWCCLLSFLWTSNIFSSVVTIFRHLEWRIHATTLSFSNPKFNRDKWQLPTGL